MSAVAGGVGAPVSVLGRARARVAAVPRAELWAVIAIAATSAAVVIVYALATRPVELVGDMPEYHSEGVLFAAGKPWWTTLPFGVAHAGMWKAPIYPAWIGLVYALFGDSPFAVAIVQGLVLAPLGVLLTWMLGRRLFSSAVGLGAAAIVAVWPLVWEYYGLLYPEALAVPATLLLLYLALERRPTVGLSVAVGAVAGLGLLIRPTSGFLLAGVAAAWVLAAGWRRGVALSALAVGVAVLVVAPWTARNLAITHGDLIPISMQDAAPYGTFNDEAANDPVFPYAWRPYLRDQPEVLTGPPVDDATVRSELQREAYDYIGEHPLSVLEAFYWNGLSRFWDVRRPGHAVAEAPLEGRSRTLAWIGIAIYYVVLVAALVGLWRIRRRRALVVPLLVTALAASIVFAVGTATRYRVPLDPVLAILAVVAIVPTALRPRAAARPAAS